MIDSRPSIPGDEGASHGPRLEGTGGAGHRRQQGYRQGGRARARSGRREGGDLCAGQGLARGGRPPAPRRDQRPAAAEVAAATGAEVVGVAGDLTRPEAVQRIVDAAAARLGRIDVLVNNAGAAPGGEILDLSEEDWQKALQLKFMGYVRCIKAVIPHMLRQGGGRIV